MGGNVTRGRAYVVGERRRELFVPGMSGTIHPTTDTGGQSGVNVTQHLAISINGVNDPRDIAERVGEYLEQRAQFALRGLQADIGLRTV